MATNPGYRDAAFHELLRSLEAMFPSWEQETLAMMLESNHCQVEQTIDQIFAMESTPDTTAPANSNSTGSTLSLPGETQQSPPPAPALAPHSTSDPESMTSDALLAQMLQDELFCTQVLEDEQLAQYLHSQEEENALQRSVETSAPTRASASFSSGATPTPSPSSSSLLSPSAAEVLANVSDKLSLMSLAMKAKMMDLVRRFQDAQRNRSSANEHHRASSRPLLDLDDDEALEDEEEEYFVFGQQRQEEDERMTRRHQANAAKKVSMWNASTNQSPRSTISTSGPSPLPSTGDSKKKD